MKKITTPEMEIVLARHFDPLVNLVVPNVSWGFEGCHELDLAVMTKAGCLYEVEIKISLSDLKADAKKSHGHRNKKIKYLYFAIPEYLVEKGLQHIPPRAGVLVVKWQEEQKRSRRLREIPGHWYVEQIRPPEPNGNYKLSPEQKFKIARLGALRIWPLKNNIEGLKNSVKHWRALKS